MSGSTRSCSDPSAGRSVNLKKKFKKKGKKVRLFGHVDAPGNEAACENGQTVQLQRKKPKGGQFGIFRQLQTNTAGDYSTKVKVKKTFTYRAFVPETSLCDDVTSKNQKVRRRRRRRSRNPARGAHSLTSTATAAWASEGNLQLDRSDPCVKVRRAVVPRPRSQRRENSNGA